MEELNVGSRLAASAGAAPDSGLADIAMGGSLLWTGHRYREVGNRIEAAPLSLAGYLRLLLGSCFGKGA